MTKRSTPESRFQNPPGIVRPIADEDIPAVASLLGELGYPTTEARLRERSGKRECGFADVFVLELEGRVVACLSLAFTPYFPDGSTLCRITALVVTASHRGRGFGAALVAEAVEQGRTRGCSALELTTAERRTGAHRFYERIGFSRTSLKFVLPL